LTPNSVEASAPTKSTAPSTPPVMANSRLPASGALELMVSAAPFSFAASSLRSSISATMGATPVTILASRTPAKPTPPAPMMSKGSPSFSRPIFFSAP
jgi:hypothetical protein